MDKDLESKLTTREKQSLAELKLKLEDGTLNQKSYDKKYKTLVSALRVKHSPFFIRHLGWILLAAFITLLLLGIAIRLTDPQNNSLSASITDVQTYSANDTVLSIRVSNTSDKEIDATCYVVLTAVSDGATDLKESFKADSITADGSKDVQVAVKNEQNNTLYNVGKDSDVSCTKAY